MKFIQVEKAITVEMKSSMCSEFVTGEETEASSF